MWQVPSCPARPRPREQTEVTFQEVQADHPWAREEILPAQVHPQAREEILPAQVHPQATGEVLPDPGPPRGRERVPPPLTASMVRECQAPAEAAFRQGRVRQGQGEAARPADQAAAPSREDPHPKGKARDRQAAGMDKSAWNPPTPPSRPGNIIWWQPA